MGRRIVTSQLQASTTETKIDDYFGRLMKYIPSEVVGGWIAITGLIKSASDVPANTILWILLILFTGLTSGYILKQTFVPKKPLAIQQTIISTIAFVVWVFALGEPFNTLDFYRPIYGSVLLIVYNLVIPLIIPNEDARK